MSWTHCTPDPDCVFDLIDGWDRAEHLGVAGPVIVCSTHGLLAPGAVYSINITRPRTPGDHLIHGTDPRLTPSTGDTSDEPVGTLMRV